MIKDIRTILFWWAVMILLEWLLTFGAFRVLSIITTGIIAGLILRTLVNGFLRENTKK